MVLELPHAAPAEKSVIAYVDILHSHLTRCWRGLLHSLCSSCGAHLRTIVETGSCNGRVTMLCFVPQTRAELDIPPSPHERALACHTLLSGDLECQRFTKHTSHSSSSQRIRTVRTTALWSQRRLSERTIRVGARSTSCTPASGSIRGMNLSSDFHDTRTHVKTGL